MTELFTSLFGLILSLAVYLIAAWFYRRTTWMVVHPLLVSSVSIIALLQKTGLSYAMYYSGAQVWNWLVGPATVALAVPLYRQRRNLFSHWQAVIGGAVSGVVAGILAVWILGRFIGLPDPVTLSMVPKSVTIPIAVGISAVIGGVLPLTVCAGVITGIFGAMVGPAILNLFRVRHDVSRGIALGTTAHGAGVQQALQANEVQGAMAGLSVGLVGFVAVIIAPVLVKLLF
jgi:putative effector of murein hydrolase